MSWTGYFYLELIFWKKSKFYLCIPCEVNKGIFKPCFFPQPNEVSEGPIANESKGKSEKVQTSLKQNRENSKQQISLKLIFYPLPKRHKQLQKVCLHQNATRASYGASNSNATQ